MLIFILVLWLLTLLYAGLFFIYRKGWHLQPEFVLPEGFRPGVFITILIPARNEAERIGHCLRSILENDYPAALFEIIVIDDFSSDQTAEIVRSFNPEQVRCLSLRDYVSKEERITAYKKKALEVGVGKSRGELIITTDADCELPCSWLKNMAAAYQLHQPVMIAAPVVFAQRKSLISVFQTLDFMSLQGITAAVYRLKLGNMSNGANLAFSKQAFYHIEGYKNIDHLASGDDFLLMHKMEKSFPGRIFYLKSAEAVAATEPQPDMKSFLRQRIRWASKSGRYDDKKLTALLLLVYLFNVSFLILLTGGFWEPFFWLMGAGMLLIKTIAELFFLLPVAFFFNRRKSLLWFPFLQPFHILYIIIAGFLGFFGTYQWKGRKVR